jgi:sugar lactone lactonase YvrE
MQLHLRNTLLTFTILALLSGCGTSETEIPGVDNLPISEPELTFDAYQDDDFFLARPFFAGFGPRGNIYVTDNGTNTIHMFGPDGMLIESIGGEGSGPGEFTGLMRVTFDEAGTLIAFDVRRRAISLFNRDANRYQFQESFIVQSSADRNPNDLTYAGNGSFVANFRNFWAEDVTGDNAIADVYLIDKTGAPADSVLFQMYSTQMVMIQNDSQMRMFMSPLFSQRGFLLSAGDGYIYYVFSGDGEVIRYDLEGREVGRFNLDITQELVNDEDRSRFDGAEEEVARAMRRHMPDIKPAISAAMVDTEGRIWVRLERRGMNDWVRYGLNGEAELRVRLPENVSITHANNEMLLGYISAEARVVGFGL